MRFLMRSGRRGRRPSRTARGGSCKTSDRLARTLAPHQREPALFAILEGASDLASLQWPEGSERSPTARAPFKILKKTV